MNPYNPYAAPIADARQAPDGGIPARGEPQPWEIGEAVKGAWEIYKGNWAALSLGYLVIALIGSIPGQVAPLLAATHVLENGTRTYYAVHAPLVIVGWVFGEFFMAGFVRAALRATRSGEASIGDFFSGGNRFGAFLAMSFLRAVAVVVGLVLFIVPGVIVALGFSNAPFFVVEQNLGPVASLKASWQTTEGQKGNLFLFSLVELGIMIAGVAACCLGVFVAVPVMLVARAILYMRMSGTAPPPAGYGPYAAPGAHQSPPGYGPPGYGQGGPPGYGQGGPPGYGPPR